jgi:hypothetical protein
MFWRKRLRNRWLSSVAGFMVAVLFLQLTHELLPTLVPSLIGTAEAAYNSIQPDGDGTVTATRTTCATAANYDCLNDGVATSSTPSTAGDYLTFATGNTDNYTMGTLSNVNSVSAIYVPVYHRETGTNMTLSVSLWDSTETVQYGSTQALANASVSQWDTATISGLNLTQAQLDGLRIRLSCAKSGGANRNCIAYSMFATVSYSEVINVTVNSLGTQQDLDISTSSAYVGGAFSIVENTSSRSITSITIAEQGTVDAQTNLDNIKLYYDLDTTAPYTCDDVSYASGDTQYGSTDTDGFSSADGTATFTGSVTISTTQAMCIYVVLDVLSGATAGNTVEIQISNSTTDIVGSGSPVISPTTAVALPGTTTLRKTILTQENYHWRNDDGNEGAASSATAGSENTSYNTMPKSVTKRLRLAVSNEGNKTSSAVQYRLEYATKVTTCTAATGWTDVGGAGGDFDMSDTGNLTNGNDTTNISVGIGGVSNPNTTFLTPNAGVRDTSSQTGNITLTSTEYVELEYAIIASSGVTDGTTYCFRVTNAGMPIDAVTNYAEATIAADVQVASTGTQTATMNVPATGQYAGGLFRFTDTTAGAGSITSITITASGTVDAQTDISSIKLRYDFDTSAPYTCDDVSYASGDTQYGSTVTNFNGSNKAVFTDSVSNSPTQTVCLYVEYNVGSAASNGELLDIRIADPSTEVVISGSTIAPASPVDISGVTTFVAPYTDQTGYHWRNNDGDQAGATSATAGSENTSLVDVAKNTTYRLRFSVANTGLTAAPESRYRLEWAQKVSVCSAATGWERVDTVLDAWQMAPTGNLTEGNDTTDIAVSAGGVSNGAGTFLSNNNGVNDTTDLTASSTLSADNYLDLEYAISATNDAVQGATYCFRVTAAGTELDNYGQYGEATIKLDTDFKVQRGISTITGDTLTITAGVDYEVPSAASSSFIRITNTQLTGAGPNTGNTNSNADDVTVYITNPGNILTSITFARGTSAAGNTRVSWEIIEYTGVPGGENEIIVRRQEAISYGSGNTTVSGTVTNTVVTDADAAVFITGQFNADTGRNAYGQGFSTAAWNTTNNQVDLTRGLSGSVSSVSYALVEFTGSNWKVQRISHTYTAAGTVETSSMTAVNSLSRTFTHTQKRTPSNNHADIGHEVWLSGIGQVSFLLDAAAATPGSHVSVAWVIENTQSQGLTMKVYRANSSLSSGATAPETNVLNIGSTLDDVTTASLFVNNRSDGATRSFPEPMLGARLLSTTQYELWRSDTSTNINFRTEVVEWPTAARKLEQNYYRMYVDNDALTPSDPWPVGATNLGENTEMTADDSPLVLGDKIRLRMTISVTSSAMPATLDSFRLQYAERLTTCSAISDWKPLGEIGSTTAPWRGVNNTPGDGTALSTEPPTLGDLLISIATVAGTYEEENNSALNPYTAFPGDELEYDWVVQHNGAKDKTSYCFRMVEADNTQFVAYNNYPVLRTVGYEPVIKSWRWYGDETNETPTSALGSENVAPIDITNNDNIKLRVTIREKSGAAGVNNKFIVQYSEYSDFSQNVRTLTSTSTCVEDSLWCYADGAGIDNQLITTAVISNADPCVGGVGSGCGTHNEGTSTVNAVFDQLAFTTTEYEFTLKHAGARANAVYYFRFYDTTTDEVLGLDVTATYPSLVTEGAQLVSSLTSVSSGTTIGDITTDVATTPTSIGFGSLTFNNSFEAAQQLSVSTNATEGYQLLVYVGQQLTNTNGEIIPPVSATNLTPASWSSACSTAETGCFGYHTTDGTLANGSGRFAPDDSYAALETTAREVMHSSVPTSDTEYIVYRILVSELQSAGDYTTSISYLSIPVF